MYMNLESTRPRGRPRNRWQDEVREDGRIVGEEWQEKVYNKIIIIFINCKWVDTQLVAVVISHITRAGAVKVDYCRFSWGGLHGKHVVATGKGKTGTITAFAVGRATWEVCTVFSRSIVFEGTGENKR
jgi:hypothetical protein